MPILRWMIFVHVMGVVLWVGSTLTVVILHRKGLSSQGDSALQLTMDTTKTIVNWVINPSAFIVLLSGVGLIVGLGWLGNPKPLWISFMERFGGGIALLSIGVTSVALRRAYRKTTREERVRGLKTLSWMMASVGTLATLTIFVVMFRLS